MHKNFAFLATLLPISSLLIIFSILLSQEDKMSGIWSGTASRHLLGYIFFFAALIFIERKFVKNKVFSASTIVLLLVTYSGLVEFFSTILFLSSAYCLGRQIINFSSRRIDNEYLLAPSIIIGIGFIILFFGGLILTPYNSQNIYCIVLSLPILSYLLLFYKKNHSICDIKPQITKISNNIEEINTSKFYGFLFLLSYTLSFCLFPTITSDENAVHLSIWSQLTHNGQFTISPESQVWSAAPNTVSLIHGIISLIAGSDAKGTINFCILLLTIIVTFRITKDIGLDSNDSIVISTLFISTPIISILLVGLQTDLFLGLVFLSSAMLLFSIEKNFIPSALSIFFCGALALSSKLPGILIAAPIFTVVLVQGIRKKPYKELSKKEWAFSISLIIFSVLIAIWPYAKAYYFTENPLFPLYNKIFESPYFDPINFKDGRWDQGATFNSFQGLFFESKRFMEVSNNFVGGFQYFLLIPFSILLIFFYRKKNLALLTILALAYLLPIFFTLQYMRYFYAALPILSILVAIFFLKENLSFYSKKLLLVTVYCTAFLNFLFSPGASWLFSISPLSFLKESNKEKAIEEFMPEYYLNISINKIKSNANVLFAFNRSYGAMLAGRPIYNTWYSNIYSKEINNWRSENDILQSLQKWEIDFIYWDQKHPYSKNDKLHNMMSSFLVKYGKPVTQVGSLIAFSASADENIFTPLLSITNIESASISGSPIIALDHISLKGGDIIAKPLNVKGYGSFKYSIKYFCGEMKDIFIAQINWDTNKPFYKVLTCSEGENIFSEIGMIPVGAKNATLYLSARTNTQVKVNDISIGGR